MIILWTLLLTVGTALFGIYLFFKKRFTFWGDRGFVFAKPSVPWGNVKGMSFSKTGGEIIANIYKQFPKERFVGIWMFHQPALLIRDPELVKTILVRDFMVFHDRGFKVNEKVDPLSANHLLSLNGTKWRNMRVKLTPTFTSGKMKMMFPIMTECSKTFSQVLEKHAKQEEVIEVKDFAARFTTDIISSVAFGIETNSLNNPDSDFRKFGQDIFNPGFLRTMRLLIARSFPKITELFSLKRLPKETEDFFINSLKQTIAYRNEQKVKRNDFLELLIQLMTKGYVEDADAKNDEKVNTKFTFEEAAAQSFVFFLAGFETSSTTMQFALYELAKNKEIQKKTRDEIKAVLAKHNGEMTYEAVMEMPYVSRVIDESLRLWPPAPYVPRECNTDYKIPDSDLVLPKGAIALIPIMGLHHDPEHYPDPHRFDPDRFLEQEKAQRHHYTYLPFGEGPRICIGMRFGLLQAKVGLIALLNKYEFSVAPETSIPLVLDPRSNIVLSPLGGMNLRITEYKE